MTFYWWSHWFWITVMSNLILCPLIVVVHTYPSQDSSQEYNRHQTETTRKLVTKLYQTSTTWATESSIMAKTTTAEKTILQSVTMSEVSVTVTPPPPPPPEGVSVPNKHNGNRDGFEEYYYDQEDETETETETKQIDLEEVEYEMESRNKQQTDSVPDELENDIKRSAEHFSKSSETESKIMELNPTESSPISSFPQEEKNNYTNFTDKVSISSTNETNSSSTSTIINVTTSQSSDNDSDSAAASSASSPASSSVMSTLTANNNATALPHAAPPATPKIVKTHSPLDWLNSMADVAVSPPTARVTTDINDDRFPFTLENVHKTEDLRREESEPRTRKSKGLSAEYKHGYASINYSSESKNLLTRSASTTVNENESEESNISSEALSVQRPFFMDVGAISAICFTVFGICCTVGTIGIVLYRRRFLNKPQALSEPDSSVYIDDSTMRVSDNSDEMYSLDNDSFLNSLEAMTIQNYWTDTVKHTKL